MSASQLLANGLFVVVPIIRGLLSMRQSAEELGWTFAVEPGPGGGTWVVARFPLLEV